MNILVRLCKVQNRHLFVLQILQIVLFSLLNFNCNTHFAVENNFINLIDTWFSSPTVALNRFIYSFHFFQYKSKYLHSIILCIQNYVGTITSFIAYFQVHALATSSNFSRSFMYISPNSGSIQTWKIQFYKIKFNKLNIWTGKKNYFLFYLTIRIS